MKTVEIIKQWLEDEEKSAYVDYINLGDVTMDGSFDLEKLIKRLQETFENTDYQN